MRLDYDVAPPLAAHGTLGGRTGPAAAAPRIGHPWYPPCRSVAEFALSLVMFVLAIPIILLAAALVRLTSRGPAFYAQTRLGLHGRAYRMYKIRSMYHDCERHTGPCWASRRDPRITPVGRAMRLTHVDELPQLWNVLKGAMTLIGPRPERPEF